MFLDTKLDFQEHLKSIFSKVNKAIYYRSLITYCRDRLYLQFISPLLDLISTMVTSYMIKHITLHFTKNYTIQYKAALAITGGTRGTSKEKLYDELGLETLEKRRWYRKLCCFFKIFRYKCPKYLFNIIPTSASTCSIRNTNNIPLFKVKHNFFRDSFFPSVVIEWNKLDLNIRNSESLNICKKTLLNFIRLSVFNCHNPKGVKLLTRLRQGLSHLHEHNFKPSFQDSLNPISGCGNDIETSAHYLLHCPNFPNERSTFLNIIGSIDRNILARSDLQVTETLLYGDSNTNNITNTLILNATIYFLIATKRFDGSLL